jgi:hypothetical protein
MPLSTVGKLSRCHQRVGLPKLRYQRYAQGKIFHLVLVSQV